MEIHVYETPLKRFCYAVSKEQGLKPNEYLDNSSQLRFLLD